MKRFPILSMFMWAFAAPKAWPYTSAYQDTTRSRPPNGFRRAPTGIRL